MPDFRLVDDNPQVGEAILVRSALRTNSMILSPFTTFPQQDRGSLVRTDSSMTPSNLLPGVLLALFQLVGRSHFSRFFSVSSSSPILEPRLWILICLTSWLFLVGSLRRSTLAISDFRVMTAWRNSTLLFLGYMIASGLWAPNDGLAIAKMYDLLLLCWSCVLVGSAMRLFGVQTIIDGFWVGILGACLTLAGVGIAAALASPQGITRLAILGGGPNVFGRNMGLLALVGIQFVIIKKGWLRLLALVTAPVATLLVLSSGSRGAMLALFVGIVVLLAIHGLDRRLMYALFLGGIVMIPILATQLGELATTIFHERFVILLLAERYFTNRDTLIMDALYAATRHPLFGLGLSGFAELDSPGSYPHNFVLEALSEGGIVGLFLLSVVFVRYLKRWRHIIKYSHSLTVAALSLLFISSSISGDLFDARGVFYLLLMATAIQATTMRVYSGRSV